jgi:hypothetical protein
MLRFLLISTALFLSFTLLGQDQAHPVFVSTANLELIEKESAEFSRYTADLKTAQSKGDNQAIREAQGQLNKLLEKVVFRSQFVDPQLAIHMDLDEIRKLKQEWVDGVGFKYYINLKRFRNTPGLTEIQMTPEQYQAYLSNMDELKALKASFASANQKNAEDRLAFTNSLIKANELVNTRTNLLLQ